MIGKIPMFLLACLTLTVGPGAAQRTLSPESWRSDLRVLADSLVAKHRRPFDRVPRESFQSAVSELDARIPTLEDHEIIIGFARIAALLRDGHTRLEIPQDFAVGFTRSGSPPPPPHDSTLIFHHLPVRFELFADGLFIRTTAPELTELIGARVLQIGHLPTDSALERIRPVVYYDNEPGFRFLAPKFLSVPEVLHATGVSTSVEQTRLVVRTRQGMRRDVDLAPVQPFGTIRLIEAGDVAGVPIPLWERNLDSLYWMKHLPGAGALYVQLNELNEQPGESVAAFAARIERTVRDSAVSRVIIDLRHNPGGNNMLNRSLLQALIRSDINRFGQLFILIGRETFSAAQTLANQLEYHTNGLFVGEPTGSTPSHFGDATRFRLPASGLTVRVSTVYWRDWNADDQRQWTPPHIPVVQYAGDYFAGRDPVLAAALGFRHETLGAVVADVAHHGGIGQAYNVLFRTTKDVHYAHIPLESTMLEAGRTLLEKGWIPTALAWFQAVSAEFPGSAAAHLGHARALERSGKREEAAVAVNTALAINPADAEAQALRRRLSITTR